MTRRFFSVRAFTLVFGLGYAVAVYGNYPLFRYYPLVPRFSLHDLADTSLGPAMSWYGWIATAAVLAVIVTAVIPKRIGDRIPAAVFWIVTIIMLAAAWYREREWFLSAA
jgi:hypothetical protein